MARWSYSFSGAVSLLCNYMSLAKELEIKSKDGGLPLTAKTS